MALVILFATCVAGWNDVHPKVDLISDSIHPSNPISYAVLTINATVSFMLMILLTVYDGAEELLLDGVL